MSLKLVPIVFMKTLCIWTQNLHICGKNEIILHSMNVFFSANAMDKMSYLLPWDQRKTVRGKF